MFMTLWTIYCAVFLCSIKVKPLHKEPLNIAFLTVFGNKSDLTPSSEILSSTSSTTICLGTVSASERTDSDWVKQLHARGSITIFSWICKIKLAKRDIPDSYSNYRLKIPVCGEAGCSSSLRCSLEMSLEGLVGLQGSLGGKGEDGFSVKAFLAIAVLFFTVFLGDTGTLGLRLVIDFGDSKGEGNCLDLDFKEATEEDLL